MCQIARFLQFLATLFPILINSFTDCLRFLHSLTDRRSVLAAENLFLRKQLAFYQEHQIRPRRLTAAARFSLLFWSRFCNWGNALVIVKPETLIGWHRKGFKLFWKWKSRPGRPRIPVGLRHLIAEMVRENPSWGQVRIADELFLKLGIKVSPRTVRAYWPSPILPTGPRPASQSWQTFIHNHAHAIVACDFMVAVTVRFRILYILVVMEIGSRRILHFNVTDHPTAEWTLQQLREAIPSDHSYRFLIHDRHATFSTELDNAVESFGITPIRTPVRAPQANAFCERLIGTVRRECLDYVIPIDERHLRSILRDWVAHYNRGRPHSSLGPGLPDRTTPLPPRRIDRHHLAPSERVTSTSVLGGLHHEYGLEPSAA
jgi:putative transposase